MLLDQQWKKNKRLGNKNKNEIIKKKKGKGWLTQECRADVFGDLIARPAGFGKMAQLFVQHPFELENKEIRMSEFEIVFIFLIRI